MINSFLKRLSSQISGTRSHKDTLAASRQFLFRFSLMLGCLIQFTLQVPHAEAGRPRYIELQSKQQTIRGRVESKNKHYCWLVDRDGQLNGIELNRVENYKTLSATFSPYSIPELKNQLAKEFGKEFKIASDGNYIVCAPAKHAYAYAQLFDETYRSFTNYFSRKGFRLPKPEFPLVAVIFPDFSSYATYQKNEGLAPNRGILGYYMRTSNRVALYENNSQSLGLNEMYQEPFHSLDYLLTGDKPSPFEEFSSPGNMKIKRNDLNGITLPIARINQTDSSLEGTIIHEATHQIAFNTGLHSRVGDTPKWIIEGLATVFEVPGVRDSGATVKAMQRANRERYMWFRDYMAKRRKEDSLLTFISSDNQFQYGGQERILDAYSEAWALSFFLLETQPVKYARYLRKIKERESDIQYPAEDRVEDFKEVFGNGTETIERDFLRFIERM